MKFKVTTAGLLALGLTAMTAQAWDVSGVVSCPNGNSACGIVVCVSGVGSTMTSGNGAYQIQLPDTPGTYTICVETNTLPAGTTVSDCVTFSVDDNNPFASIDFTLSGSICGTPPSTGRCWLTGGGTIDKAKGKPHYSYGGVVNPGCSPTAAGGGNWNVVDHAAGLHFKGLDIVVISCSGVPDRSPKVNVNIIDFAGTGTIKGVSGNPKGLTAVTFVARAIDNGEPGHGKDQLYLQVVDSASGQTLLQIGSDPDHPATIATGNLQIHTSSCR
jgi:hypothetical protein